MKAIYYILFGILLASNSTELFIVLLNNYGIFYAVVFSTTFIAFYLHKFLADKSKSRLAKVMFIISRVVATGLCALVTYYKFGLTWQFGVFVLLLVLMEICLEIFDIKFKTGKDNKTEIDESSKNQNKDEADKKATDNKNNETQ